MIEHQNSFLVHQCLQAVNSGDTETLRALWADDIVWHTKGSSPWQGEINGPDAIFEYLAQLGEVGTDGYHIDVDDIMIGEERASIVLSIKASREGKSLDTGYVLLARLVGRRVHEIITVPIDADRVEAFWRD
jgi:uncharacterized protein